MNHELVMERDPIYGIHYMGTCDYCGDENWMFGGLSEADILAQYTDHLIGHTDFDDRDALESFVSWMEDAGVEAYANREAGGLIFCVEFGSDGHIEIDEDVIAMWREQDSLYKETLAEVDRGRFE